MYELYLASHRQRQAQEREKSIRDESPETTSQKGLSLQIPAFFQADVLRRGKDVVSKDLAIQFRASNAQKIEFFTPDEPHFAPELVRLNDKLIGEKSTGTEDYGYATVTNAEQFAYRALINMKETFASLFVTIDITESRRRSSLAESSLASSHSPLSEQPSLVSSGMSAVSGEIPASILDAARTRRGVKSNDGCPYIFLYMERTADTEFTKKTGSESNTSMNTDGSTSDRQTGILVPLENKGSDFTMSNLVIQTFSGCDEKTLENIKCTWRTDLVEWSTPAKWMRNKMVAMHSKWVFVALHFTNGGIDIVLANSSDAVADTIKASLIRNGYEVVGPQSTWTEQWIIMSFDESRPIGSDIWIQSVAAIENMDILCAGNVSMSEMEDRSRAHGLKGVLGRATGLGQRLVGSRHRDDSQSDADFTRTDSMKEVASTIKLNKPRRMGLTLNTADYALRRVDHSNVHSSSYQSQLSQYEHEEDKEIDALFTQMNADVQDELCNLYDEIDSIKITLPLLPEEHQIVKEKGENIICELEFMISKWDEFDSSAVSVSAENEGASKDLRTIEDTLADIKDISEMQDDRLEVATQRMLVFIKRKPQSMLMKYLWGCLSLIIAIALSTAVFALRVSRPVRWLIRWVLSFFKHKPENGDMALNLEDDNPENIFNSFLEERLQAIEEQRNTQWQAFSSTVQEVLTTDIKTSEFEEIISKGIPNTSENTCEIEAKRKLPTSQKTDDDKCSQIYRRKLQQKYNVNLPPVPRMSMENHKQSDMITLRRDKSARRERRARRRRECAIDESSDDDDSL
eukprot:CFRG2009T1